MSMENDQLEEQRRRGTEDTTEQTRKINEDV